MYLYIWQMHFVDISLRGNIFKKYHTNKHNVASISLKVSQD